MKYHIFMFVLLGVYALAACCTSSQKPNPASIAEPSEMNTVLQLWAENKQDKALEQFIALHRAKGDNQAFRVFARSEKEFVQLPEAKRSSVHDQILKTSDQLRDFSRFVYEKAKSEFEQGSIDKSTALRKALKRLGEANTGEDLTELANMVGDAIVELADRPFESKQRS